MRSHPDLSIDSLPDAEEDLTLPVRSKSIDRGGMNLRSSGEEGLFEWPEAGPSVIKDVEGSRGLGKFGAKAAAAMSGAVMTSLLMTPFDVLKTRLQTVQPHPKTPFTPSPSDCCQTTVLTPTIKSSKTKFPTDPTNPLTCITSATSATSTTSSTSFLSSRLPNAPARVPSGCLAPSKWAGIWGETITYQEALSRGVIGNNGGSTGTLVMPRQVGSGWSGSGIVVPSGFWTEVGLVWRETGIRGLWKGVGTTLTMSIPSAAIYMLGYEHLLVQISPYFTGSNDPAANVSSLNRSSSSDTGSNSLTAAPLIAGSLARTLSATVISPIEMFRTRLQALPNPERGSPTYGSTAAEMVKMVKSKGPTILWRGLGPTLWRDVPFSGLYWAGFEIIKSNLSHHSSSNPTSLPLSPLSISFISGALSGTFSALVTQPFDVLKTRRQVFTPSIDCSPAALKHRASTLPLAIHVIKTEGWRALFAGTVPRCGKIAPACGLMIACYEGVGRYLGGGDARD